MIGVPTAVLIATVLLLLLLLITRRASSLTSDLSSRSDPLLLDDAFEIAPCPPEFVARIFAPGDWEFVSKTKSPQLEKLFRRERKQVALLWVQQTSIGIRRIMREHKESSRESHDLSIATETKLLLLYASLMSICGLLFLAIQASGPQRVRGIAVYADGLSQRLVQAQQAFGVAAASRGFHGAGSA